jgi:SAM-dependent methyltransferase
MPSAASFSPNHWPDSSCARAFWGQHELPPYRQLLAETLAWADPQPRQRWLDLGCGGGQLTQGLWLKSNGSLAEIVGLDCAAANSRAFAKLRATLRPSPGRHIRFVRTDFSDGLSAWKDRCFDGVVSGLAIQYAEDYSPATGCWTTAAYDRLLVEVCRLLRPDGAFIFSVNVPEPSWLRVGLRSLGSVFHSPRPLKYLKDLWRMGRYGRWLKREARRGRFHYLACGMVAGKLAAAGFVAVEHRLSYAGQAYLFRCRKPAKDCRREQVIREAAAEMKGTAPRQGQSHAEEFPGAQVSLL